MPVHPGAFGKISTEIQTTGHCSGSARACSKASPRSRPGRPARDGPPYGDVAVADRDALGSQERRVVAFGSGHEPARARDDSPPGQVVVTPRQQVADGPCRTGIAGLSCDLSVARELTGPKVTNRSADSRLEVGAPASRSTPALCCLAHSAPPKGRAPGHVTDPIDRRPDRPAARPSCPPAPRGARVRERPEAIRSWPSSRARALPGTSASGSPVLPTRDTRRARSRARPGAPAGSGSSPGRHHSRTVPTAP